MSIKLIVLATVLILISLYGFYLLYNMPYEIMKNMENEAKECLKKQDKEYEVRQEFIKHLKRWLFN